MVGISKDDLETDAVYICKKILNARLFENNEGKAWSESVVQKEYEILLGTVLYFAQDFVFIVYIFESYSESIYVVWNIERKQA